MLEIALHNSRQHRQFVHSGGLLTLARADAALWAPIDPARDDRASEMLEIVVDGDEITLALADGSQRFAVPARFTIGDTRFEISAPARQRSAARRLEKLHREPGNRAKSRTGFLPQTNHGPSPATLSKWFTSLGTLNRWTSSLQELYIEAARVAVEAVGLDGAIVLRRRDHEWEIAASYLPNPELGIHCDSAVLDQLLDSPETLFQSADTNPHSALRTPRSPLVSAVVVSPICSVAGSLAGAVYGYRSVRDGNGRRGIRYLEAHLIELLAGAVSDGMSRLEHEAENERRRVLLEQLAAAGIQESSGLAAVEREVTLLFADLRGFTQLSAGLDMNLTCELLGQVMDCLTAAVMEHDGLVVDYYGDGLSAMWNAPADQADHVELACRAALRMLDTLPAVAADWTGVLGADLQLGIGVHTGLVQVGNAGSRHRSKFGPRGANVHLTSRLEKATKDFGVPLLITQPAACRLSNRLHSRTVGHAQLPGFTEPIEVFTIEPRRSNTR